MFNDIVEEKPLENHIQEIFIDENNIFDGNEINDESKKIIIDLNDRTGFSFDGKICNDCNDMKMEVVKEGLKEKNRAAN